MTENIFISVRLIHGKRRRVITDENGSIINMNPSKEESLEVGIML